MALVYEATVKSGDPTDELAVYARRESQVQTYARSAPVVLETAIGAELIDIDGNRYLDFLAGAGSLNYGHNNPVLKRALLDYIAGDGIAHSLDLHTRAKSEFLEEFERTILEPRELDYVVQFTGPTGANAVEAAMKLARKITGRPGIVHFTNSFHGATLGALAVTGNATLRGAAGVNHANSVCMPFDGYFGPNVDTLALIEKLIRDESNGIELPAAMIVETVQGEGGLNVASTEWLQGISRLCREHGILLIVDDIQSGCGRTGTFFSFEEAGIVPDLVTVSKSLSGFGLPFSVLLIARQFDRWRPGEHNGTFRGNNHAFVTATAMLRTYWRSPEFAAGLAVRIKMLTHRLEAMQARFADHVIRVKGRGFLKGLEFADAAKAKAVCAEAFALGLLAERCGPHDEVVKCMAPLTISSEQLEAGLAILERAMAAVLNDGHELHLVTGDRAAGRETAQDA